ncbi:hypothetical protein ACFLZI_03505, partial [Nitrospirota bacterium]
WIRFMLVCMVFVFPVSAMAEYEQEWGASLDMTSASINAGSNDGSASSYNLTGSFRLLFSPLKDNGQHLDLREFTQHPSYIYTQYSFGKDSCTSCYSISSSNLTLTSIGLGFMKYSDSYAKATGFGLAYTAGYYSGTFEYIGVSETYRAQQYTYQLTIEQYFSPSVKAYLKINEGEDSSTGSDLEEEGKSTVIGVSGVFRDKYLFDVSRKSGTVSQRYITAIHSDIDLSSITLEGGVFLSDKVALRGGWISTLNEGLIFGDALYSPMTTLYGVARYYVSKDFDITLSGAMRHSEEKYNSVLQAETDETVGMVSFAWRKR